VSVPAVLMVRLFMIVGVFVALQVPVPVKTRFVVPKQIPLLLELKLPVIFIVFEFNVTLLALLTNIAFVTVILFGSVVVPALAIKGPVGLKVKAPEKLNVLLCDNVNVPAMFKLEDIVIVYVLPPVVKLFQAKVFVLKVVAADTFSVEPVVTTVPAV
jgi:hypothetical protein